MRKHRKYQTASIYNISKNYNFLQLPLGDIQGWKRFYYIKSLKNTIFSTKMDLFWVSIYFNGIFFWILRPQGIGNWSLKRALAHTCAFGRKGGPRGTPKPPKFVMYIVKLFLNSKFWVGTFIKSCSKGSNWYIKFSFHKGWGTHWVYRQGQTFNFTLKLVGP